jgi:peptidoglycan hydrolase-like protein with peptidoglycan-binding domain
VPPPYAGGAAGGLLQLQRAAGNAAVAALVQRQQQPEPLEIYELTLPEFVGNARLEQAKLNDPPVKRRTDRTGPAVYAIQKALILAGHRMPRSTKRNEQAPALESPNDPSFTDRAADPDGIWGDETDEHVWQFQREHDLSPDARVGNKTLKALQEAAATPVPQPILPAGTKVAGVDSFSVKYDKDPVQDGRIRIDVAATFTDDATHSSTVAEYQQFVSSRARIRKPDGTVIETPASLRDKHDDGWHRDADRVNNRPQTFAGNSYTTFDVAGFAPLADDEVLDFRFTAEHLIVDLARNSMVIDRRGPHTVVVKGRAPRRYQGAPLEL